MINCLDVNKKNKKKKILSRNIDYEKRRNVKYYIDYIYIYGKRGVHFYRIICSSEQRGYVVFQIM